MVFFICLEEDESSAIPLAEAEIARRPDISALLRLWRETTTFKVFFFFALRILQQ